MYLKLRYVFAGVLILLIIILLVPLMVNWIVNTPILLPIFSVSKTDTWIGFYGSFIGALIGAFAVIFITLRQINSNKEIELYKEDKKDLTFLIMIEQFISSSQMSIFTNIYSPILEKYRQFAQSENLTVKDLEKYFTELSKDIFSNITIKDKYKLSFSFEDLGITNRFDNKELFDIEKLIIKDDIFNVTEKHYEWASHLNNEESIKSYFKALSFIESLKKEFSKNFDEELNNIVLKINESDTVKILDTALNPNEIKELVRKEYWKSIIGNRFTFFMFSFIQEEELGDLLKLVHKEIEIKNERIKSYRGRTNN